MILEIKDLSFTYPAGIEALKNISFNLAKGGRLGVIGGNGAGKSTLLFALGGLFPGGSLKGVVNSETKDIGLVFQNPDDQIIGSTVEDDIAFSLLKRGLIGEEVKSRVKETLDKVYLTGFEKRSAFDLSFGEKKRLGIASILISEPEIIMFDEPSLGLDPKQRRQIMDILKSLKHTLIIATYDLDLIAEVTDKILVIDRGQTVATGETDKILNDFELLKICGMRL